MEHVFRTLLNMTYTASAAILIILALRLVFKAFKAPGWACYALWGIALFRLLCPFSFESALALLPSTEPIPHGFFTASTPEIYTGLAVLNSTVNPALARSLAPMPTASANPAQILFFIGGIVWAAGAAAVFAVGATGACKLCRKLKFAIRVEDGVYESEQLDTAFVWGIFRPRVYLPAGLDQKSRAYILLHEHTHSRRLDHIWKLLFYAAAAFHWFNPLVWLAFRLFEKDMELSCDESVLKRANEDIRKPYCETLLSISAHGKAGFSPVFFGESGIKARIKNVLTYKKPAFFIVLGAILLACTAGVVLMFNPISEQESTAPETEFNAPSESPAASPQPNASLMPIQPDGISPIEISPSINFIENGSVAELIPLEGNDAAIEAVKNAIFMHVVLSSAWSAEDMANYPDRIDFYVGDDIFEGFGGTEEESSTLTAGHIFMKDGRPCIQLGDDGMWTILPEEAYNALLALREKAD